MRLAISNIAWDVTEDAQVMDLLNRYEVDAIDIAPGKYFPVPQSATAKDIAEIKNGWAQHGIEITGMQALLFGTQGLNVFGSESVQNELLAHLNAVCRIGGQLGARRIVFGSPKNRDRSALDDAQTRDKADYFFDKLGDIAQEQGVIICLEPNPVYYGANYMTTSAETAAEVLRLNHPAIKMQFDTGALAINQEDAQEILLKYANLIGHVHISEQDLIPPVSKSVPHHYTGMMLNKYLPDHIATIEMLATKDEPHLSSIERALAAVKKNYCAGR